jgi:menaquinone-specific isochorismate synthase
MTHAASATLVRVDGPGAPPAAAVLERAFDRMARVDRAALVQVALPAPLAPAAALLHASADAVVWEPRDGGAAWAGAGVAAAVTARGRGRFAEIAAAATAIGARAERIGEPPAPRWFGGFAFAPGSADAPAWAGLGDASFVLPRWSYIKDDGAAQLVLTLAPGDRPERAALHAELAAALAALATPIAAPTAAVVAQHDLPATRWHDEIEQIRAAIAGSGMRRWWRRAPACSSWPARSIPRRWWPSSGGASRRVHPVRGGGGGAAFVGASPERLVRKRGRVVDSEALAGSCARTGDDAAAAAALAASAKDRAEHAWVVAAIEAALAPRCRTLDVPSAPAVRTLRQILHLHTPITGELAQGAHVLELVAALHPTPAVGGTPTADAVAWIAAHEPTPRGWYASPVGWFDAAGDGEFAVAIRSGLLAGATATLFAGAGIVAASDPAAELAETELKLRALSDALGLESPR